MNNPEANQFLFFLMYDLNGDHLVSCIDFGADMKRAIRDMVGVWKTTQEATEKMKHVQHRTFEMGFSVDPSFMREQDALERLGDKAVAFIAFQVPVLLTAEELGEAWMPFLTKSTYDLAQEQQVPEYPRTFVKIVHGEKISFYGADGETGRWESDPIDLNALGVWEARRGES